VSIEAFSKSSSLRGRLARAGNKKALEKRTPTSSKDKMIDLLALLIGNNIVVVVTITLLPLHRLQSTLEKDIIFP
jgi:Mg2+/Co2+ transporter CorB